MTIKERWVFFCDLYPNHHENHTHDLMVNVLAPSTVDRRFKPWSDQTKDYKIGICCFSAKHAAFNLGERAKTGWLGIRIMCPSGATYLPADCCFSELAL